MANKSFFGRLASKNKKSSYEVSKETGISEDKIKEVFTGERSLPTKHVDAVVKSIQSKDNSSNVDYLTARRFFDVDEPNFVSLRNRFGYGTQRSLAQALKVPACYISDLENDKTELVPKSTLIKIYDFFQDELNVRVKPIKAKKGGRKKYKSSGVSVSSITTSIEPVSTKPKFILLSSDFDAVGVFNTLKKCSAESVVSLYRLLDDFINGK